MLAFRIADRRYPVFDGTGARMVGGRWNSPGRPLIYAAESFSLAMLEVLVHANLGRVPRTHVFIEIRIPNSVAVENLTAESLPGWDADDQWASRDFGDNWLQEQRSAVLLVPSVVARSGRERNVLINPEHHEFKQIEGGMPEEIQWDSRLFPMKQK